MGKEKKMRSDSQRNVKKTVKCRENASRECRDCREREIGIGAKGTFTSLPLLPFLQHESRSNFISSSSFRSTFPKPYNMQIHHHFLTVIHQFSTLSSP